MNDEARIIINSRREANKTHRHWGESHHEAPKRENSNPGLPGRGWRAGNYSKGHEAMTATSVFTSRIFKAKTFSVCAYGFLVLESVIPIPLLTQPPNTSQRLEMETQKWNRAKAFNPRLWGKIENSRGSAHTAQKQPEEWALACKFQTLGPHCRLLPTWVSSTIVSQRQFIIFLSRHHSTCFILPYPSL